MPGQEGIPSVFSPMARTRGDLSYFTKALISMKPWKYDHSVHPIPWRDGISNETQLKKKFKVAMMVSDGVVDPSPACLRALQDVGSALHAAGHEVIDVAPASWYEALGLEHPAIYTFPSAYEALYIGSQLLNADGCKTFKSFFRTGEWEDTGAKQMSWYMGLPSPIKYVYYLWVKYVRRDDTWAGLLRDWKEKSAYEQWKLVAKREAYKAAFHEWWENNGFDFMITPPNATPALPHDAMHDAVSSCGYTFMFNLVSFSPTLDLVSTNNNSSTTRAASCPSHTSTKRRTNSLGISILRSLMVLLEVRISIMTRRPCMVFRSRCRLWARDWKRRKFLLL